ncbi:hypothetical protein B0H10DRAFT_1987075 [Mycena sp. CBHHK59/15]|nr:hypothetical protein B0H10DRAFT_1987075 [Mycena sp. CBHHK59/15]
MLRLRCTGDVPSAPTSKLLPELLGEPSPEFKVDAAPEGTSSVGVPACEGASVGVAACGGTPRSTCPLPVLTLRGARGVVASRQTRRAYGSRDGRRCCVRGEHESSAEHVFWQASDRAQGAEAVLSEPQLGTQRFPARTGESTGRRALQHARGMTAGGERAAHMPSTAPAVREHKSARRERQWGLRGVGDHMSCSGPCPDARLPHVASARLRRLGRRTDSCASFATSHPLRGATSSSQRRLGASSRIVEPSDSSGVRLSRCARAGVRVEPDIQTRRTAYLARVRAVEVVARLAI